MVSMMFTSEWNVRPMEVREGNRIRKILIFFCLILLPVPACGNGGDVNMSNQSAQNAQDLVSAYASHIGADTRNILSEGDVSFGNIGFTYNPSSQKIDVRSYIARARMKSCLLYTSPSPRDATLSRMPSSA